MSISEKANDLLNKFGGAQYDYVVWSTQDNLVARDKARQEIFDYITELEAAQKEALSLLPELEQGHYYCDDCWYSCPKAVDGCCDERQGDECNCGADNYNALLAKIIGLLTPEVQE